MDVINEFKVGLALLLEKEGSSLEEFEAALASENTDLAIEKLAGFGDMLAAGAKGLGALAMGAPELALALSAVAGTVGGGGLYAMDNHLHKQDERLKVKQEEADRVKLINERLKSDYNLQ